jgi:hypothetical protein
LSKAAKATKPTPEPAPTFLAIKRQLERCHDPARFAFVKYDAPGRYEVRTDLHEDGRRASMVPFAILEQTRGVKLTLFPLLKAEVRAHLTPRLRPYALSNRKSLVFKTAPGAATLRELASLIK